MSTIITCNQKIIQAFQALANTSQALTWAQCMAWIYDEVGRAVALPREIGGIPLDEIGATGFGLSHAVDVASGRRRPDEK